MTFFKTNEQQNKRKRSQINRTNDVFSSLLFVYHGFDYVRDNFLSESESTEPRRHIKWKKRHKQQNILFLHIEVIAIWDRLLNKFNGHGQTKLVFSVRVHCVSFTNSIGEFAFRSYVRSLRVSNGRKKNFTLPFFFLHSRSLFLSLSAILNAVVILIMCLIRRCTIFYSI